MIGITKSEFENSLLRQDIVDYYLNMSKEDIEYKFGNIILDIVGYDQHNSFHCYELFEHTLRTVIDIPTGELSNEEIKLLKIAAFLHDVGKPRVAKMENGKNSFEGHEEVSAKMAEEFLKELGYEDTEIKRICFFIKHINDFLYFKDELPYYYEHHPYIRKITDKTVAEKMIENQYDFSLINLDDIQTKAVCISLIRNGEWPTFEDEKEEEISIKPVNMEDVTYKLPEIRLEYIPSLKDYKMLLKLAIANYKSQAKRSYQRGKLIATRSERVRVAAIIEAILPEAYKIFEECVSSYQAENSLTQELLDVTEEYNALIAMNQIEQMREDNAKNLMNKFRDMKIRLTMKS